jgi:transposase InsO family protein
MSRPTSFWRPSSNSSPPREVVFRTRTRHRVRPYRPQANGKAERFNRTLVDEWAYAKPYLTNGERLRELEVFVADYNYARPHSAIGNRPPASRLPSTT